MAHESSAPVARVLDKLAGKAKEIAGQVLGDEDLETEGELQQSKFELAKESAEARAEAAHAEEVAALAAQRTANQIQQQEVATDLAHLERQRALERERAEAEAQLDRTVEARADAIEVAHAREQRTVEASARDAITDTIGDHVDAATEAQSAQTAEEAAEALAAARQRLEQQ